MMSMEKGSFRGMRFIACIAAFFCALAAGSVCAQGAVPKTISMELNKTTKAGVNTETLFGVSGGAYVSSAGTDNSCVLDVTKKMVGDNEVVFLLPKQEGTTNIQISITDGASTKDYTAKVIVRAWDNPLKTLKVGTVSLKSSFNKKAASKYKTSRAKLKGKLAVKPAKGWKVLKIRKFNTSSGKYTKLKSGSKYTFRMNRDRIIIKMKHTKTGFTRTLTLKERS